jgi:hypothetical protein
MWTTGAVSLAEAKRAQLMWTATGPLERRICSFFSAPLASLAAIDPAHVKGKRAKVARTVPVRLAVMD